MSVNLAHRLWGNHKAAHSLRTGSTPSLEP